MKMDYSSDINNNVYPVPNPSFCLLGKRRVHFPSIQELDRVVAPPGYTPRVTPCESRSEAKETTIDEEQDDDDATESVALSHLTGTTRSRPLTDNNSNFYEDPEDESELPRDGYIIGLPPSPVLIEEVKEDLSEFFSTKKHKRLPEVRPYRPDSAVSSTHATIFPSRENLALDMRHQRQSERTYPNMPTFSRPKLGFTRPGFDRESLNSASATEYPSDYCSSGVGYNAGSSSRLLMSDMDRVRSAATMTSSVRVKQYQHLDSVLTNLKSKRMVFDRATAINALKRRILRGEKVSYEEIVAIKNLSLPIHQKHFGWRLPWSIDLYCYKGLVHFPTPHKPVPERGNTFGTVEDLRLTEEDELNPAYGKRRYVLNLAGFRDDEIYLYLEGKNKLVIRAVKEECQDEFGNIIPPTIATETVVLPPDLPADNLRIVRRPSGTTIIEESWRY